MKNVKCWVSLLLISLMTTLPGWVQAEDAATRGLQIAREADARDSGFVDFQVDLEMVLRTKSGRESQRALRLKSLEVDGDGDRSLTIFDSPPDVRGTALLTYTHKTEPDDQWLNLPALGRVKRIASRNKSGPFVGSEFAFEDLSSQEVEKYTYLYVRDEPCGEFACFVIERDPVDPNSGYTRQLSWIDQDAYRLQKVEYYDRKNSHLKTLEFTGYQLYAGKFWRADRMDMFNHQTGKSTALLWRNYQFGVGLSAEDFNRNSLQRLR